MRSEEFRKKLLHCVTEYSSIVAALRAIYNRTNARAKRRHLHLNSSFLIPNSSLN